MEVYAECRNDDTSKMCEIEKTNEGNEIELSEGEIENVRKMYHYKTLLLPTVIPETESESEEIKPTELNRCITLLPLISISETESETERETESEMHQYRTETLLPLIDTTEIKIINNKLVPLAKKILKKKRRNYKNKVEKKSEIKLAPLTKKILKKKRRNCKNKVEKKESDAYIYYNVERVIKRRLDRVLVKWEGWSDEFNTWVHKDDIKNI